jgi:hypothetical protein
MALPQFVYSDQDTTARHVASYLKRQGRIATELEPDATAQWSVYPIFSVASEGEARLVAINPEVGNPVGIKVPEWADASYGCYAIVGSIERCQEHQEYSRFAEAIARLEFYLLAGDEL